MIHTTTFRAGIFDMDGLLVDSEPLWRLAEIQVLGDLGVPLTDAMARTTTGMRIKEIVEHWRKKYPWQGPSNEQVVEDILDEVIGLIKTKGKLMPGALHALEVVKQNKMFVALASSSPSRMVAAVLAHFDIGGWFEVWRSAEHETYGKPNPAVYLRTADELGVDPKHCLAFEDSFAGLLAAKAAQMHCVVVPAEDARDDARWVIADRVLDTLEGFEL